MKAIQITMTEQQRHHTIALLKRTPIKGEEALIVVELMNLFLNAKPAPAAPESKPEIKDQP
jgi:hypothetical protein